MLVTGRDPISQLVLPGRASRNNGGLGRWIHFDCITIKHTEICSLPNESVRRYWRKQKLSNRVIHSNMNSFGVRMSSPLRTFIYIYIYDDEMLQVRLKVDGISSTDSDE